MTPPPPEPLLPDADPSGTARAALKALFEKVRREKLAEMSCRLWSVPTAFAGARLCGRGCMGPLPARRRVEAEKAEFRKSGAPVGRTHERVDLLFAESAQAPFTRRARGSERQPDKEIGD